LPDLIWGVYLPSDDLRKREELHEVIQDAMSSENDKASHTGLQLPYKIMAGDPGQPGIILGFSLS